MAKSLVTSSGRPIQIGLELGRGGEGSVYEVPGSPTQVAKLYHCHPDAVKQAKLHFMATAVDSELLKYAAWPQDTLHESHGGPVMGFLMPKVTGREPIHMVYSPAHRRQERPKAAWDFLIYVARNTAAAFETLHAHGHVLGDVNQGNVLVGIDSKVVLIDTDSYQVNANGKLHLCEVGVSHFTPPELQGLSSFRGVTRTTNHDNFGLALLIFHLLFGGRHPYSGTPLNSAAGNSLEADIKAFRYAYATDSQSRGIAPPPKSISVSIVPEVMQAMFNFAFVEAGISNARPTAKQWVVMLDATRSRLRKCSASEVHLYTEQLQRCPWCNLEQQGVIYFVDFGAVYTPNATGFILAHAWSRIEAVQPLVLAQIASVVHTSPKPRPLPENIPSQRLITFYQLSVVATVVALLVVWPNAWIAWALAAWIGWTVATSAGSSARTAERTQRQAVLSNAQQEFDLLLARLKKESGPEAFNLKKADLLKIRNEYQSLPSAEQQEIEKLQSTAIERQKEKFLDGFFIHDATIPGIGSARKAALRSFGIETAADLNSGRIRQVRGFGDDLTSALMSWKVNCERRFTFNPNNVASESDRNVIRVRFRTRKLAMETTIAAGAGELQRLRQMAETWATKIHPQLDRVAKDVAQAKADLSLL